MNVVEHLLDAAQRDLDLLAKNAGHGDVASAPRDLDFVFYAPDEAKANLVASFVTDNSYGRPVVEHFPEHAPGSQWRLTVSVLAPATPEVVCSISGLMVALSHLYSLEYDGWGSDLVYPPKQLMRLRLRA